MFDLWDWLTSGYIFVSVANMLSLPFLAMHSSRSVDASVTANVNAIANSLACLLASVLVLSDIVGLSAYTC